MSYATIDDLRSQLGASPQRVAYDAKMLHDCPDGAIVDRAAFILEKVAGKRVLEFGASGAMHDAMVKASAAIYATDLHRAEGVIAFDLDDITQTLLPSMTDPDVIVCGEVVEHLANPGFFVQRLRRSYPGVPVIITVPNAHSRIGYKHIAKGIENVNIDHVAWYSPRTLRTLVERYGYRITEFAYYNGDGPTAEGLIAVVE